jgi:hypothetical protein
MLLVWLGWCTWERIVPVAERRPAGWGCAHRGTACVPTPPAGRGCRGQSAVPHCTVVHAGTVLNQQKHAAPEGVCCAGTLLQRCPPSTSVDDSVVLSFSHLAVTFDRVAPASEFDLNLNVLVESAMLAACTGLVYHFSASFRLESYLGALFPFPVVLAAARWGCGAAWRTLVSHCKLTASPVVRVSPLTQLCR